MCLGARVMNWIVYFSTVSSICIVRIVAIVSMIASKVSIVNKHTKQSWIVSQLLFVDR